MNIYLLLIIGMVFWGMYPILTHYFVQGLNPLFLASIAVFFSSLPFIIILIVKQELGKLLSKKVLKTLLPVALFGGLGYVFLFSGTSLTTGANTGILLQIEPIYALFIGVIVFREKLGMNRILATLFMVLGAMFIVYKGATNPNIGDLLVLLTTLMWQISHSFAKKLLDLGYDRSLILGGRQFLAGLTLILFCLLTNNAFPAFLTNPVNIKIGLFLGLYQALVTFIWYTALRKMPLSRSSAFLPLTALVAMLGSIFFLKETISTQQIVGLAFIISGMLWLTRIKK